MFVLVEITRTASNIPGLIGRHFWLEASDLNLYGCSDTSWTTPSLYWRLGESAYPSTYFTCPKTGGRYAPVNVTEGSISDLRDRISRATGSKVSLQRSLANKIQIREALRVGSIIN